MISIVSCFPPLRVRRGRRSHHFLVCRVCVCVREILVKSPSQGFGPPIILVNQSGLKDYLSFVNCTSTVHLQKSTEWTVRRRFTAHKLHGPIWSDQHCPTLWSDERRPLVYDCGLIFDVQKAPHFPFPMLMSHSHTPTLRPWAPQLHAALNNMTSDVWLATGQNICFLDTEVHGVCVVWGRPAMEEKSTICSDFCQTASGWLYNCATSWNGNDVTLKSVLEIVPARGRCCAEMLKSGRGGDSNIIHWELHSWYDL